MEAKQPAMVPAADMRSLARFRNQQVAPVGTYIRKTMQLIGTVFRQQKRLVEMARQQGQWTAVAIRHQGIAVANELPGRKKFFFGLLKDDCIGIKIRVQGFGFGN
jgi:hypothetical protein